MPRSFIAVPLLILGLFLAPSWPLAAQDVDRSIRRASGGESASAESRRALVIGNAQYEPYALPNPANDARSFASLLRSLDFEVREVIDGDRRAMKEAIRAFTQSLRAGSVGVFYYAGHAIQVDGTNYMIPLAADIRDATDVEYESVDLGFLLDKMGEATERLNIVILDACRNNPFPWSRAKDRGLAKADAPIGTLIAYATAPGQVAQGFRLARGQSALKPEAEP